MHALRLVGRGEDAGCMVERCYVRVNSDGGFLLAGFTEFHSDLGDTSKELEGFGNSMKVYLSCSFALNGTLYVLGGYRNKRSVKKVGACGMETTSIRPPINLYEHVCTTIIEHQIGLVCASWYNSRLCYRLDQYNILSRLLYFPFIIYSLAKINILKP